MSEFYKLPRIYADQPFQEGGSVALPESAHHYLRNVMRLEQGSSLRLFNGHDGEFIGALEILDKKNAIVRLTQKIKEQPREKNALHLIFSPIRKERMDWLVEKAVELGATHLHPVLTQNTDLRKINEERISAQIVEAAEQCERLDIPVLYPLKDLSQTLADWDINIRIYAAFERYGAKRLSEIAAKNDLAVLIGPSGGFTQEEMHKIATFDFVTPVSLGENILRSETAAIAALSRFAV